MGSRLVFITIFYCNSVILLLNFRHLALICFIANWISWCFYVQILGVYLREVVARFSLTELVIICVCCLVYLKILLVLLELNGLKTMTTKFLSRLLDDMTLRKLVQWTSAFRQILSWTVCSEFKNWRHAKVRLRGIVVITVIGNQKLLRIADLEVKLRVEGLLICIRRGFGSGSIWLGRWLSNSFWH